AAAREAVKSKRGFRNLDARGGPKVRLYAEPFSGTTGATYVAVALADRMELEDEYASLIEAFGAAALAALLLVIVGGSLLVRKSTAPRADRKSTRLNSSHGSISYDVFCLKKKTLKTYSEH